jgi:hypothetical protein
VAHAVLIWFGRGPGVVTGLDDARYVLLARSLTSLSYREVWLVDLPVHAMYPPGYPTVLALWGAIAGTGFDGFILLQALLSAGAIAVAYVALRALWSPALACLAVAPLAASPALLERATRVSSEPLFTLLTLAALAALARRDPSPRRAAAAGALALAAALTRTIGVTLVLAILADWLAARRWRRALALVAAATLTVGTWLGWTAVAPEQFVGESYVADARPRVVAGEAPPALVATLARRVARHVPTYLGQGLPSALGAPAVPGTIADNIAVFAIAIGGILGWLVAAARLWRPAALYVLGTAAVLVLWPYTAVRFLVPLVPLLAPAIVIGVATLVSRWRADRAVVAAGVVAAVLFVAGAARSLPAAHSAAQCPRGPVPAAECVRRDQASFLEATVFLRDSTPATTRVLGAKAATVYYYSRRPAAHYAEALSAGPDSLPAFLARYGVTHVLLGSVHASEAARFAPLLMAHCGRLAVVRYFPPRTYLFRLTDSTRTDGCEALVRYRRQTRARNFVFDP